MSYKVIHYFTDLSDKAHPYEVGDTYPLELSRKVQSKNSQILSSR